MGAPQKYSADQIKSGLATWGGNISAVAAALGCSRNNLTERIKGLGLHLESYRAMPGRPVRSIQKPAPVSVRPAHVAALREARFDLQYVMRQELTTSDVLAMMLDEELAGWIKRKLETLRGARPNP